MRERLAWRVTRSFQPVRATRCAPRTELPGVLRIGGGQKENLLKGVRDEEQRDQVQSGIQVSGGA